MSDLLENGAGWLRDMLRRHVSQRVTYRRGVRTVVVSATLGQTAFRIDDPVKGSRIERTDRDFLVAAEDLIIGGVAVEPQRGDQVLQTVGSSTHTYEVLAPNAEPPWRWADAHRKVLRIHTKLVCVE